MTGELKWLRDANARWQARAEAAAERADSAEAWARDEQARRLRAEAAWSRWRLSWAGMVGLLAGFVAHDAWGWSYWVALGSMAGGMAADVAVRAAGAWWRRRPGVRPRTGGAP